MNYETFMFPYYDIHLNLQKGTAILYYKFITIILLFIILLYMITRIQIQ